MAEKTWAITDTSRVKEILGIAAATTTYDAEIEYLVGEASNWVESYCGRYFRYVSGSDDTEYYDINESDRKYLYLKRRPIVSITSVNEDPAGKWDSGTDLTEDTSSVYGDYRQNATVGALYRVGSTWATGDQVVKVVYKGGYTTTTAIRDSRADGIAYEMTAKLVTLMWHNTYRGQNRMGVSSKSKGDGSLSFVPTEALDYIKQKLSPCMHKWGV